MACNALRVRPGILTSAADTTGLKGLVFRASLAVAPASTPVVLPDGVKGCWVDILARGVAVQCGVTLEEDAAAPTLVFDQAVTVSTGDEQAGMHLFADERYSCIVPPDAARFVYIAESNTAGAFIEMVVSGRRG